MAASARAFHSLPYGDFLLRGSVRHTMRALLDSLFYLELAHDTTQTRHALNVICLWEHVHRLDTERAIAQVMQEPQVTRQRRRAARDIDQVRHAHQGQRLQGFGTAPGTRWVEDGAVCPYALGHIALH